MTTDKAHYEDLGERSVLSWNVGQLGEVNALAPDGVSSPIRGTLCSVDSTSSRHCFRDPVEAGQKVDVSCSSFVLPRSS